MAGRPPSTGPRSTPTTAPALVSVPNEVLKNAFIAGADLDTLKLKFRIVEAPSVSTGKGRVMAQNPAPGTKVPIGTEVELTVSSGPV